MKFIPDPETTPHQKMAKFENPLGRILSVSKDDLDRAVKEDEQIRRLRKGKPGPKPKHSFSASDHASDSED